MKTQLHGNLFSCFLPSDMRFLIRIISTPPLIISTHNLIISTKTLKYFLITSQVSDCFKKNKLISLASQISSKITEILKYFNPILKVFETWWEIKFPGLFGEIFLEF